MKRMIVAALALVGVFVALYLMLYKMGAIGHLACGVGGCERVNTSPWSSFLGVPVAAWGVGFYVLLFVVALVGTMPRYVPRRGISVALAVLTGWGVIFSGWLTWLELHVIHAVCEYCVTSASIVTVLFLVSVADLVSVRRARRGAARAHGSSRVS